MVLKRDVKAGYATAARKTGDGLTRMHLLPSSPPPRAKRGRHWAYSLFHPFDPLALVEMDVPWWTYRAIDVVDQWLAARPTRAHVFEYGSGASTVWLARRAAHVTTVEHDVGFAAQIGPTLASHSNVTALAVGPVMSGDPVIGSQKEGYAGLDFSAYVASIEVVEEPLDLVVIDGRAREACLHAALPRLADDGIIVFDNTGRRRYRDAMAAENVDVERLRGLTPTLPYPDETSILRKRH